MIESWTMATCRSWIWRWAWASLLLFSLHGSVQADSGSEWVEVVHAPEIKILRRKLMDSPIYVYRAEAMIEAPLDKVLSVVTDTERRPEWAERVQEARVVERVSSLEKIEYVLTRVPWPLKDREFVVRSRLIPDRKARELRVEVRSEEHPRAPLLEGHIRGWIYRADFVLRADGARTQVTSETHLDPRGSVPAWVVNAIQKTFPRRSIANLIRQAARPDVVPHPLVAEYGLMGR